MMLDWIYFAISVFGLIGVFVLFLAVLLRDDWIKDTWIKGASMWSPRWQAAAALGLLITFPVWVVLLGAVACIVACIIPIVEFAILIYMFITDKDL